MSTPVTGRRRARVRRAASTLLLSPVRTLTVTPSPAGLDRRAGAGLRRVEEDGVTGEDQPASSATTAGLSGPTAGWRCRAPGTLFAQRIEEGVAVGPAPASSGCTCAAVGLVVGGQPQHVLRRALDDEPALVVVVRRARRRAAARNRTAPRRSCPSRVDVRSRARQGSPRPGGSSCRFRTGCSARPAKVRSLSSPVHRCADQLDLASVSVPVLSVHSTSIAPTS